MKPHRGTLILVFGILGIVSCFPLGIAAWVMGKLDLKEMDAGTMDPSGRGNTNAGRICGMIGTLLAGIMLVFVIAALIVSGLFVIWRRTAVQAQTLERFETSDRAIAAMAPALGGAFTPVVVRVAIGGTLLGDRIEAAYVSPDFFAATAANISRGRTIQSQDCRKGSASAVVVLSHDFWRDRVEPALGGTDVIGSRLQIDGQTTTVIGIVSPGFRPPGAGWLWLPRSDTNAAPAPPDR
jgi:hypothetical protein